MTRRETPNSSPSTVWEKLRAFLKRARRSSVVDLMPVTGAVVFMMVILLGMAS